MANRYKEFKGLHLPAIEKEVLARWNAERAFQKSIDVRKGAEPFVFYEGPPSANGMPGIHHVISRTLKDLVCRYKTMQGFKVERKGGWDTHGLPIELGVEKELGITKEDIGKKISVAEYNQKCREAVLRYKDKWDELTMKMGYWVDLEHPYITFTNEYIESLWWCLKQLYEKGYLYKSVSIQPYSPAAGTGLSSHELNQPGTYRDVKDTSATVLFSVVRNEKSNFLFEAANCQLPTANGPLFVMAWTTTPWTLPSNLGLTVGPNIDYVLVKSFNPYTHEPQNVILAKALLHKYFKEEGKDGDFESYKEGDKIIPYKILSEFKGHELEGMEYEPLLPYPANSLQAVHAITPDAKPWRVLLGDFVTTEDGTGIVHTAPAFGADDFKVGKKYNIGILTLVDREGKFVEGLGEFSGRFIKDYKNESNYQDVNVDISVRLKKEGRAFKVEKYEHSYPHCWRTDKPVVYYPLDAWFIKTTAVKDRMVELNKTINWKPESTGTGRFGNWLENMVDWNLSRSRYWGTPLPIWRSEDGEEKCIGSIPELNEEIKKANEVLGRGANSSPNGGGREGAYLHDGILDLHKPYVDEVILVSKNGKPMHREPDLIDVWFDSGAMPYAQWHYPFENKNKLPSPLSGRRGAGGEAGEAFPANFIAEGVDQTRGWFYTLHALGVMLFDSVAYKTCVSNGLVLDKAGNKMSKRLGNVVDPFKTIEEFGADATRWYLITNASPWDNLKFDLDGIKEVQRKFFGTLYNTYQFFALYANVDGFTFKEDYIPVSDRPEIDRWILSSLQTLIKKVTAALDDYEPTQAGRLIEDFVDEQLSNWYVRLCRRRFWKGEYEADKIAAYQTLYECLETIVRLMAPISPFFSDEIFLTLNAVTGKHPQASVHHVLYPTATEEVIDQLLEERMLAAQEACSLILSIRKKVNIKVRQPLSRAIIATSGEYDPMSFLKDADIFLGHKNEQLVQSIIQTETNVKRLDFVDVTELKVDFKVVPDYKALKNLFGKNTGWVGEHIKGWSQYQIQQFNKYGFEDYFEKDGKVYARGEQPDDSMTIRILKGAYIRIVAEDIPGWSVAASSLLTVALDINVTPELEEEGNAREFVNRVQKIRKDSGFELTDRIDVKVAAANGVAQSLAKYNNYICAEILADTLEIIPTIADGIDIEVNDNPLKVIVIKKG